MAKGFQQLLDCEAKVIVCSMVEGTLRIEDSIGILTWTGVSEKLAGVAI